MHDSFLTRVSRDTSAQISFAQSTQWEPHSAEVFENRDLFLDFLIQNELGALNTLAEGPPETQLTHHYPAQPDFSPPWTETDFAQIDCILTKVRFRSAYTPSTSKLEMYYPVIKFFSKLGL